MQLFFFIEKLLVSVGQGQVGEGGFTNFTLTTEPVLLLFICNPLNFQDSVSSKHAGALCSGLNVRFDRGPDSRLLDE